MVLEATGRLVDKAREKGLDKKAEALVDKTHDKLKEWHQVADQETYDRRREQTGEKALGS